MNESNLEILQGTKKGVVYTVIEIPEPAVMVVRQITFAEGAPEIKLTVKIHRDFFQGLILTSLTPNGNDVQRKVIEVGDNVCFFIQPTGRGQEKHLGVHLATPFDIVRYRKGIENEPELGRVYQFIRATVERVFFFDQTVGVGGEYAMPPWFPPDKPRFEQGDLIVFEKQRTDLPDELIKMYGLGLDESEKDMGKGIIIRKANPLEITMHRKIINE